MHARFYHPEPLAVGQLIELTAENKHHAARVLRLKKGDFITLFDGNGGEYLAHIAVISKSGTTVAIEDFHDIDRESPLHIELAQAICVNEKMDWIIQKTVEMGVTSIQPVSTERSIVHLSDERSAKRLHHWQKIVISACEQCGRNQVPKVYPLTSLLHWLSQKKTASSVNGISLMLSTAATTRLSQIAQPAASVPITLAIGPEGGFTADEGMALEHAGFIPLRLGQRILRTESAPLAAISALQAMWGDF